MDFRQIYLKKILFLVIISTISRGVYGNNYGIRCKRPKAYAFCGSHTAVGTQWFFDSKHSKCLPYKYCLSLNEMQSPSDSLENRFETEIQCHYVCKLNKPPPPSKKRKSPKRIKYFNMLDSIADDRDPSRMRMSRYESKNPMRCMKPKSYSFCGSHTVPRTHWYYNKHSHRCLPYKYCENVEDIPQFNDENNFYSERQCSTLCKF